MRAIISGICLAALLAAGHQLHATETGQVTKRGGRYFETIDRTFPARKGGTLRLDVASASISVVSWSGTEVNVIVAKEADTMIESHARGLFDSYQVELQEAGGDVTVNTVTSDRHESRAFSVSFSVKVPSTYNLDVSTSGGSIKIGDLEGNVEAATSGGSISVGAIRNGDVDIRTSGGSLKIDSILNGNGRARTSGGGVTVGDVSGDLVLRTSGGAIRIKRVGGLLTAETAGGGIHIDVGGREVNANTAGGKIEVGDSEGPVTVRTAGGGIKIGATKGDVRAETAGGSIRIGVSQGAVKASTAGGGIKIDGAGGPVSAETAGGSIRIKGAQGSVDAETAGGSVEAELLASGGAKDLSCRLETSGGDVTVHIQPGLQATINARIDIKRRAGRDYRIYSDVPLTMQGQGTNKIIGRGKANGGGVPIDLRTVNGDIHIKTLPQ